MLVGSIALSLRSSHEFCEKHCVLDDLRKRLEARQLIDRCAVKQQLFGRAAIMTRGNLNVIPFASSHSKLHGILFIINFCVVPSYFAPVDARREIPMGMLPPCGLPMCFDLHAFIYLCMCDSGSRKLDMLC